MAVREICDGDCPCHGIFWWCSPQCCPVRVYPPLVVPCALTGEADGA